MIRNVQLAFNKIIEERFPRIADEFDMEIIDYGYIDNDGYIMYIEMKNQNEKELAWIGNYIFLDYSLWRLCPSATELGIHEHR